uniref:Na_Ca_ex domain-containing protein n=1 Tax=Macrostomum lignano TaxID=282301 RepID=A0A1I8FDL3_9PLAT
IFNEDEVTLKTIRIPIIDDYEYEADKEFFIDLSCPEESGIIGDPVPGEFDFASTYFHGDPSSGVLRLVIDRMGAPTAPSRWTSATEDGSAVGGDNCKSFDYVACNEQKTVEIRINEASAASKQFTAILKNPSFGAKLGAVSGAVCFIGPDESKHDEAQLAKEAQDDEEEELTYKGQFIQAMSIDAGEDEDGNPNEISCLDLLLHFCTFFFKVLIALVPPTQYLKAYPAFVISLIVIGTMTAFVEQLGNLLGCVLLGIHQAVTGITIVAIGTSLPDTFASRTAALQDEYADNSVGNVTGSNSVNVFLGLGLPWCIATIYAAAKGKSYCVDPDNLFQSLVFFLTVATVCIITLFVRRAVKWVCGVCMISLWVLYVILASLKAYNILQFNVDLPVASGVCSTAHSSV